MSQDRAALFLHSISANGDHELGIATRPTDLAGEWHNALPSRSRLAFQEGDGVDYDARRAGTQPLVADDADVIAGHAARMALDVLVHPDASAFPHPAYVIGLSKEWIFEEPFQTDPVDFVSEGEWQIAAPETQETEAIEYVLSLLEQGDDADRTGT